MTWTSTVLSSSPFEVVIKANEAAAAGEAFITWAQLSDLFEHPDTITGPASPQMASITGQRQRSKTDLIVKSIDSSHGQTGTARSSSLSWENSAGQSHIWNLPNDPMFKDFGTILKFEGDLHATNAVKLEETSGAMTTDKNFDVIIVFGVVG